MIQLTPHISMFLSVCHTDFRKGIDSLAALCQQQLKRDPMSGAMFVFTNRRRTSVKILSYDGSGFWLCMKRFSSGQLKWWPAHKSGQDTFSIDITQMTILLNQGHPMKVSIDEPWRKINTSTESTAIDSTT